MNRSIFLSVIVIALVVAVPFVAAGERTIAGTISKIDREAGTFSVTDGMGARWNYKALPEADIDLSQFEEGDRVSVSIARATPPNMMVSADYLRKGDKLVRIPY